MVAGRRQGRVLAFSLPRLRLGPAAAWHRSYPLPQGDELIGGDALEGLMQPVWPINVQIDRSEAPQAEVQPGIIAGIETRLAQDGLGLGLPSIAREDPGPDGAAIGFDTHELHLDPVLLPA